MSTKPHDGPGRGNPEPAWPEREALRLAGRRAAMVRAGGWSLPFLIAMLLTGRVAAGVARSHYVESALKNAASGYSGESHPPPAYLLWLLILGGSCWAICTVAEVLLARTLAADYPRFGPVAGVSGSTVLQTARRTARSVDRKLGNGGGCLAVAALAATGPLVVLVWSFFTATAAVLWALAVAGVTVAHLLAVRFRLRAWRDRRRVDFDGRSMTHMDAARDNGFPDHGRPPGNGEGS